ncbi:DUF4272 domain-containing protein [Pseudomonas sp. HR96]|uniref:DUF4272 domain-containing protein n=1 Tax=Pseudomonas sp. HR96 TaxID=1027966 RepID=UPI002A765996|nr:DUF4272 domain-containing protein [Pseudomonas sp. HR96]WPO98299.1 DUF4272 domain-containing protein [Pseudomonas sp. HR96]
MCLHVSAACAYGFDRSKAKIWIDSERLDEFLTDSERLFIESSIGDLHEFRMQVESMWALAWFLGLVPYINLDKVCDVEFAKILPNLKNLQGSWHIFTLVKRRSMFELAQACDVAYCLHWAIRQVQQTHGSLPGTLDPYVVTKRRHALDWLVSTDGWDGISQDT